MLHGGGGEQGLGLLVLLAQVLHHADLAVNAAFHEELPGGEPVALLHDLDGLVELLFLQQFAGAGEDLLEFLLDLATLPDEQASPCEDANGQADPKLDAQQAGEQDHGKGSAQAKQEVDHGDSGWHGPKPDQRPILSAFGPICHA